MANLIDWPETAKVDRVIPKERLYAEATASLALKQRFVVEVQRVRWAYKLGDESLRLAPGQFVNEIQVFVVDLKGTSLNNSVLAAIDKAVPSQIIFELRRGDGLWTEQVMASVKERTGGMTKTTDYFRTGWIGFDEPRVPLPVALDMDGLYSKLLGRLLPHTIRRAEDLSGAVKRMGRIRALTREVSALERKLRTEPQLSRKIEFRRQIDERIQALAELTDTLPIEED